MDIDEFDHYVIEGKYDGSWEDITAENDKEELKSNMRAYYENEPETPIRVKKVYKSGKRVPISVNPYV